MSICYILLESRLWRYKGSELGEACNGQVSTRSIRRHKCLRWVTGADSHRELPHAAGPSGTAGQQGRAWPCSRLMRWTYWNQEEKPLPPAISLHSALLTKLNITLAVKEKCLNGPAPLWQSRHWRVDWSEKQLVGNWHCIQRLLGTRNTDSTSLIRA